MQKVGKKYTAKAAIDSTMLSMRTTTNYGDKHLEQVHNWYDYEEESVEPVPIKERMLGLKIKPRLYDTIDYSMLDVDYDLDSQFDRRSPRRRASRNTTYSKVKESEINRKSRVDLKSSTMIAFDDNVSSPQSISPMTKKHRTMGKNSKFAMQVKNIAIDQ